MLLKNATYNLMLILTCYSLTNQLDAKKNKHKNISFSHELRGFSASKLLYGIANTCNQISNAVVAETQKEKQQAVFGVLGSLFILAGDIAGEEVKRNSENKVEEANHQQTRAAESVPTLKLITTRSVSTANLPLVKELAGMKNKRKQADQIKSMLKFESTASQLVNEICLILDTLTLPQEKALVATVKSILSETLTPRN